MPKVGLLVDERFERHDTGPGHPERAVRLVAIREALDREGLLSRSVRVEARPIKLSLLKGLHNGEYLTRLEAACRQGAHYIDVPDSAICPDSYEIALLAAGGTLEAVDLVMSGEVSSAFCAIRPPGHHAERDRSMGFCLFNNIALAAERLLGRHELDRVMILDWDVHHGNGTQHHFDQRRDLLFCSLHGHPSYVFPGTGYEAETGFGQGEGYTLNIPMDPGATGDDYRRAFEEKVLPAAERFRPQFVLISTGFDAHRLDPLAPLDLETPDFEWMTRTVMDLARRHCQGRIVSVLEGGYNLDVLAECTVGHVALLAGD